MSAPITVEVSPWTLTWRGGRLGDIGHLEYPGHVVHAIQVGHWDHQADKLSREPDAGALQLVLGEWAAEHGQEYLDNVVRYLDTGHPCRCGRDGVQDRGQCAVRDGWGALQPGTYCRRGLG